jgi:hypothetical protein
MSLPQVAALLAIVDVRLQLGVSKSEYSDVTRQLALAIRAVNSPAVAEVALNAIEVLVNTMCPSESDRQAFVAEVASVFQRWHRRISQDQMMLLRVLGEEVGVPLELQMGHRNKWWAAANRDGRLCGAFELRSTPFRNPRCAVQ